MVFRNIIVIGGSAESIESLKEIVSNLPADFPSSLFVVVHVSADAPSMLAKLLCNSSPLPATNPCDEEPIRTDHVYVSRPDRHLTIEDGKVRILRGPRENRHHPAIDPLFRTAARVFGPRAVGIVLSGRQDDGSAGIYAVNQRGGVAIVQDPNDAIYKDMPSRALEYAEPHYILPARDIAPILVEAANANDTELAWPRRMPCRENPMAGMTSAKSRHPPGWKNPV